MKRAFCAGLTSTRRWRRQGAPVLLSTDHIDDVAGDAENDNARTLRLEGRPQAARPIVTESRDLDHPAPAQELPAFRPPPAAREPRHSRKTTQQQRIQRSEE